MNKSLITGGSLSIAASLLHLLIIMGGPDWYRFFGAGEGMAQLAERGSLYPSIVTSCITVVLFIWGLYAFSGAGLIRRFPVLKLALGAIALIYISRGVLGIPLVMFMEHPYANELANKMTFMVISSLVSLGIGLFYGAGLYRMRSEP